MRPKTGLLVDHYELSGGAQWHVPVISALGAKMGPCEFEASSDNPGQPQLKQLKLKYA